MEGDQALACVQLIAAIGCGLMFAAAGIAKLRARDRWRDALAAYRLLPGALVAPVAVALPIGEIAIGAALLIGLRGPAVIGGTALLVLFAAAMAINLTRGRRLLDCGCDPTARARPIGWDLVARNLLLGGALAACLLPAAVLPPDIRLTTMFAAGILTLIALTLSTLRAFTPASGA